MHNAYRKGHGAKWKIFAVQMRLWPFPGKKEEKMYRLLIVEDDFRIAEAMKEQTKMWDLDAHIVEDFRSVLTDFIACQPHIVLLDITLPFFNGYHWCSEIRKISNVPIIFISSASDNMNIVMAMNMGADDFIAKPFDMNVLVAKIQALLRRTYDFAASIPVLEHRGAFLNTGDESHSGSRLRCTRWHTGRSVSGSPSEDPRHPACRCTRQLF